MPLGKFVACQVTSYVPAGFSSLANVSISLPRMSNTFIITLEELGIEYFKVEELLNGFGKF